MPIHDTIGVSIDCCMETHISITLGRSSQCVHGVHNYTYIMILLNSFIDIERTLYQLNADSIRYSCTRSDPSYCRARICAIHIRHRLSEQTINYLKPQSNFKQLVCINVVNLHSPISEILGVLKADRWPRPAYQSFSTNIIANYLWRCVIQMLGTQKSVRANSAAVSERTLAHSKCCQRNLGCPMFTFHPYIWY